MSKTLLKLFGLVKKFFIFCGKCFLKFSGLHPLGFDSWDMKQLYTLNFANLRSVSEASTAKIMICYTQIIGNLWLHGLRV